MKYIPTIGFGVLLLLLFAIVYLTARPNEPSSTPAAPPSAAVLNTATSSTSTDERVTQIPPKPEPIRPRSEPARTDTNPTPTETTSTPPAETNDTPVATTPMPHTPQTPETTPETDTLSWGVFTGPNPANIKQFENIITTNPDYLAYFVHWANHDGALYPWLREFTLDRDRTLVLFWEASDYIIGGTDQPDYAYRAILRGDHDSYIRDFARQLTEYGGPVILIPFSEMNGDWSPWAGTKNGNTPEEAVAAYRYIHGFFADVPNVSFGWAVNARSIPDTPENQIPNYYPGDQYVDYVGVDGFNFGNPWETFYEIFDDPLTTLAQYNKPTFIFSFGTAEGPRKAAWLHDALYTQLPRYPHVTSFIYFNQDKERNWLLWSDEETISIFRNYVNTAASQ